MDPTSTPVVITRRPRKRRRARHITLAAPGPCVGIQVTIDGGPDGSWTHTVWPRSGDELLELLAADVRGLSERLWPAA